MVGGGYSISILEILVLVGVDVCCCDWWGMFFFYEVVRNDNVVVVDFLIENGV